MITPSRLLTHILSHLITTPFLTPVHPDACRSGALDPRHDLADRKSRQRAVLQEAANRRLQRDISCRREGRPHAHDPLGSERHPRQPVRYPGRLVGSSRLGEVRFCAARVRRVDDLLCVVAPCSNRSTRARAPSPSVCLSSLRCF